MSTIIFPDPDRDGPSAVPACSCKVPWIPDPLLHLGHGRSVYVCGAGGKTTLIHTLSSFYQEQHRTIVVTTTTHMMQEEPLISSCADASCAVRQTGYAFAGIPDPANPLKVQSLPIKEREKLSRIADIVLTEADGARHMLFKVPYPWEPVIDPWVTDIVVVFSRRAVGRRISDSCYHPDGVASVLAQSFPEAEEKGTGLILDEKMILFCIRETYEEPLRAQFPDASFIVVAAP